MKLRFVLACILCFASVAMAQVTSPPTAPNNKGKRGEVTQRPAQQPPAGGEPQQEEKHNDITGDVIGMHNLSPGSPSPIQGPGNGPCLYCHVPHSASNVGLWNQTFSTATYTTYTSTTSAIATTHSCRWARQQHVSELP